VREVAGDEAEVTRLLPPGVSPHTYDPSPGDLKRIAQADLLVMNGGLDLWARKLLEASGGRAAALELTELSDVRKLITEEFPESVAVADDGAVISMNPHLWLTPTVMAAAMPALGEALAAAAPASAEHFRARAAEAQGRLLELDAELAAMLAPIAGSPFVPFHDAWPYFASRYGLDLIVEIEPYPGREPSPAYLKEALGLIQSSGATVIFSESQLNRRPAEVLADEAGVSLFELDPLGGMAGRQGYADLLLWNAGVLLEAFGED
jgi:ABC-type Zn uptake system ZnuABC Zn-binding protein ZnuA